MRKGMNMRHAESPCPPPSILPSSPAPGSPLAWWTVDTRHAQWARPSHASNVMPGEFRISFHAFFVGWATFCPLCGILL